MGRPQQYDAMQRRDVQKAFRKAYNEIEVAQMQVRSENPQSPLLGLIKLHTNRQGLDFGDGFKPVIMEHSNITEDKNWYFALGVYVDLLEKELSNPLYS